MSFQNELKNASDEYKPVNQSIIFQQAQDYVEHAIITTVPEDIVNLIKRDILEKARKTGNTYITGHYGPRTFNKAPGHIELDFGDRSITELEGYTGKLVDKLNGIYEPQGISWVDFYPYCNKPYIEARFTFCKTHTGLFSTKITYYEAGKRILNNVIALGEKDGIDISYEVEKDKDYYGHIHPNLFINYSIRTLSP